MAKVVTCDYCGNDAIHPTETRKVKVDDANLIVHLRGYPPEQGESCYARSKNSARAQGQSFKG